MHKLLGYLKTSISITSKQCGDMQKHTFSIPIPINTNLNGIFFNRKWVNLRNIIDANVNGCVDGIEGYPLLLLDYFTPPNNTPTLPYE